MEKQQYVCITSIQPPTIHSPYNYCQHFVQFVNSPGILTQHNTCIHCTCTLVLHHTYSDTKELAGCPLTHCPNSQGCMEIHECWTYSELWVSLCLKSSLYWLVHIMYTNIRYTGYDTYWLLHSYKALIKEIHLYKEFPTFGRQASSNKHHHSLGRLIHH